MWVVICNVENPVPRALIDIESYLVVYTFITGKMKPLITIMEQSFKASFKSYLY